MLYILCGNNPVRALNSVRIISTNKPSNFQLAAGLVTGWVNHGTRSEIRPLCPSNENVLINYLLPFVFPFSR